MENKTVKYKKFDWYVLEEKEESLVLLMKDLLSEEVVKDICDDMNMYSSNHIAHIKSDEKYNWETSYVRKVLNDKFLESYLDKNDLVKMNDDYVRLLKLEEIDWENDIFKANDWYWLMTNLGKDGKIYQCWKIYRDYVFTYSKNKQGQTITLVDYQIDRILTKEQFESTSYKLGEED